MPTIQEVDIIDVVRLGELQWPMRCHRNLVFKLAKRETTCSHSDMTRFRGPLKPSRRLGADAERSCERCAVLNLNAEQPELNRVPFPAPLDLNSVVVKKEGLIRSCPACMRI
jgi:hypothetical protein